MCLIWWTAEIEDNRVFNDLGCKILRAGIGPAICFLKNWIQAVSRDLLKVPPQVECRAAVPGTMFETLKGKSVTCYCSRILQTG